MSVVLDLQHIVFYMVFCRSRSASLSCLHHVLCSIGALSIHCILERVTPLVSSLALCLLLMKVSVRLMFVLQKLCSVNTLLVNNVTWW